VDHYNKRITYQPVKVVVASPIMGYGGYAVQGRYSPSVFQFQQVILDGTKKSIVLTME
jgi:hypothetical protein